MTPGYVVTVTPAGDVLPGDVWEWSQGYGGGEKTVRGVERYDGAPGYVVFDDGMSEPLAAMTREGGIWTLTSREPVSRQEVATLDGRRGARKAAADIVYAATPSHDVTGFKVGSATPPGVPDHPQGDEWGAAYRAVQKLDVPFSLSLPDGSTITVEKTEGWDSL